MNKLRIEKCIILVLMSITIYFALWYYRYGVSSSIIGSDGLGYYEYFVRLFIKHNLADSGLIKFPVGTMLLQLPFTLPTLFIQNVIGRDVQGGLARPFQLAVFISALFYFLITSLLLYNFLRKKYSSSSATITVACLSLGTMIPVYVCEKASFSHIYGYFMCTTFFIYVSYYEKHRNENKLFMDFLLGALLGGCALVRNTDVIVGAAYLFYGVTSPAKFKDRLRTICSFRMIPQFAGASCVYMIQLAFWRIMAGRWVLNGYGSEPFRYIYDPQVMSVLFSDAKGLFIYCPILVIGIIGMIAFWRENPEYMVSQWIIFICVTYIIAAWWCWWLGSAYGERMYCDILCIFALPLCGFLENLKIWSNHIQSDDSSEKQKIIHVIPDILYFVIFIFVVLNLTWINGTRAGVLSDNLGTWYELRNCVFNNLIR